MVRFRDVGGINTIYEHNQLLKSRGKVFWGLWLKDFEDEQDIIGRLNSLTVEQIYVADTSHKAEPVIYVTQVSRVITDPASVEVEFVPAYYRDKASDIPIWFELSTPLIRVDLDKAFSEMLGVPTIYFLQFDRGQITQVSPQRLFSKSRSDGASYLLHLTDIHLGEDHGFRPFKQKNRTDTSGHLTLTEALERDLEGLDIKGGIAAVIVSGDIVTKGGWSRKYEYEGTEVSGLEAALRFLEDLSKALGVAPDWFFMVPGNHDIVREAHSTSDATNILIDYKHESGFRSLREKFSRVYKLSPLNYVTKLEIGSKKLVLGLLNSAYLNDQVNFSEYGFVGDDAEHVFQLMDQSPNCRKILVLHHHVLPVYEREVLAKDNKVSLTLDAASIMRRAQEVGVDVILHGHQHFAKLMEFASWSAEMSDQFRPMQRRIRVVAGGSAGARIDRLPSGTANTYGLLDISQPELSYRTRRIYPAGRIGEDW